jgi:hypothetical protein
VDRERISIRGGGWPKEGGQFSQEREIERKITPVQKGEKRKITVPKDKFGERESFAPLSSHT